MGWFFCGVVLFYIILFSPVMTVRVLDTLQVYKSLLQAYQTLDYVFKILNFTTTNILGV